MLLINYDVPEGNILKYPGTTFDFTYEKSWFEDPYVQKMIKEVDNTEHIKDDVFISELGAHTARELSGGVKTLILMYYGVHRELYFPLAWLGENCYKYLDTIGSNRDVRLDVDTIPILTELGCTFISERTGKKIKTTKELAGEFAKYVKLCSSAFEE